MKFLLLLTPLTCFAAVSISDPSDIIPSSAWATDNAIVPNYNVPFIATQPSPILAAYTYNASTTVDHKIFLVDANDTSVLLVKKTDFAAAYLVVEKYGYSSNLLTASFYGFNAAINVANGSRVRPEHINVTVHNGAANLYAYGTGTVAHVEDAWLYSSGPVSHGLYASGNGTIIGRNIRHFSGGFRSSSFSGDSPAGIVHVYDSVAHTQGIGSATFYALGSIYAESVLSLSEKGPVVFADGAQNATLVNCDSTAGLLGGVAFFSSQLRQSGASLNLSDSKITTLGNTIPGLWFGNTIVNVTIHNSQINTGSGVLVVANYSQITQDFDYYAGYEDNNNLLPAEVYITVSESRLVGDLVAYNHSLISWTLTNYTTWTGATYSGYDTASFEISLDSTSNWILTHDSIVQRLASTDNSLSNIHSSGYTLYYNASVGANFWLKGETVSLSGGGLAKPI